MAGGQLRGLGQYVRKILGSAGSETLPDGQLLERYVELRDEAAFADLVRRYGPLVLGVCQRVLQDEHAAEDAFQATFLVLVRKAETLDRRGSIGNWLYAVAFRTAVKARARAAQRRAREKQALERSVAQPLGDPVWNELRPVIDEELNRLPEKYRAPLVLSYLEGKTNLEVARELGWPAGSVSRRMAKGRELLRKRLLSRGIVLSSTLLFSLLASQARAAVPPPLQSATVQAAMVFQTQGTVGALAGEVFSLAEEVLKALRPSRLVLAAKIAATVLMAMSSVGIGVFTHRVVAGMHPAEGQPGGSAYNAHAHCRTFKRITTGPHAPSPEIQSILDVYAPVLAVAFSPDGKTIASGTEEPDNGVQLWDGRTDEAKAALKGHTGAITSLAFSPDGQTLASGSQDGTVRLWDPVATRERAVLRDHTSGVLAVAYSPDGRRIASGSSDYTVKLWDAASGQKLAILSGHWGPIYGVAFSADSATVASASQDGTVKLWDVATASERATLQGHSDVVCAVAFSPDGQTLGTSSWDGTVRLWDVGTRQTRTTLKGQTAQVRCMAFTPDGRLLVTGSQDRKIRVWDVTSAREVAFLKGHLDVINAIACAPDGVTLASGASDETIKIWQLDRHKLQEEADRQPAGTP
jgi:RNA polymerase sigma factor (sigma-70 family)